MFIDYIILYIYYIYNPSNQTLSRGVRTSRKQRWPIKIRPLMAVQHLLPALALNTNSTRDIGSAGASASLLAGHHKCKPATLSAAGCTT